MKYLITLLFPITLAAQTSTTVTEEIGTFGSINLEYKITDNDQYFWLWFQNIQYRHITDIGGFSLNNTSELDSLVTIIEEAIDQAGDEVNARWSVWLDYEVYVYDWSKNVYFDDGEHYCGISIKKAQKLLDALKEERYRFLDVTEE